MWRLFRHHPGYVALSVATIAWSMGANLAIFTVVNAIWLRPRAIPDIDRVVMVLGVNQTSASSDGFYFTEVGLDCYLRSLPIFDQVTGQVATSGERAGWTPHISLHRAGRDIETLAVGWQYFSVMGTSPRGRDFTAEDDHPHAAPVAVISHRLWQEVFDADPAILGSIVDAAPTPLRIVGIAPPGFLGARLGERADAWIPARLTPRVARPGMAYEQREPLLALARLRQGVSLEEVQRTVADARCNNIPRSPSSPPLAVVPVAKTYGGPHSRTSVTSESNAVLLVAGTAWILLAGGCVTLLSLVLMHYERRQLTFAVRLAIGSSPARLSRQLAAELAAIGAAGLAGALWLSSVILGVLPSLRFTPGVDFTRLDLAADWRVWLFGIAGLLLTLGLAGALPVWRATRHDIVGALASGIATGTRSSLRLRRTLLIVHAAGVAILLVSAGLFVRTVHVGVNQGAGFDLTHTLFVTAQVSSDSAAPGLSREAAEAAREQLFASRDARLRDLIDRISEVRGVRQVTLGGSRIGPDQAVAAMRQTTLISGTEQWTGTLGVSAVGVGFPEVLGVPVLAGRPLTPMDVVPSDASGRVRPAVVTAALAAAVWPDRSPLGARVATGDTAFDVVGVIGDHSQGSVRLGEDKAIYFALDVAGAARRYTIRLSIRTADESTRLIEPVRLALADVFPHAVGVDLATGHDVIARDLGRERLGAAVFSGFGLLALGLGIAGVYGLVAYYTESRQRDIGVRLALGATASDLAWATVWVGLTPVAIGTAIGLGLGALLTRVLQISFVGIGPLDPTTYLAAGGLLIAGAFAAATFGARRIHRLSPLEVLRVQ